MTTNSNLLPRADFVSILNNHAIYRVWEIPGYRDSDYYDGTGIVKTYNMDAVDGQDFPNDPHAIPALSKRKVGNMDKTIIDKNIHYETIICPECDDDVEGKVGHGGEKFCPECGLVLGQGDSKPSPPMVRDEKAAGRYNGD